jgi:hypothetical protein
LPLTPYDRLALQVDKLLNQQEEKRSELDELLRKTPQDLWNTDLDNFLSEWQVRLRELFQVATQRRGLTCPPAAGSRGRRRAPGIGQLEGRQG